MEPLVLRCCHFYGESQAKPAALRVKIKSRIEAQIVVKPPVIPTRRMLSAWLPEQAARPHGNREGNTAIRLARPRNFLFKAGQFVDLILLGDPPDRANGLRHTFSIASSPSAEEIVVATRMRDTPFKRALAVLPLGTDLRIEGPMGSFNLHNNTARPAVLLAGVIGIAPFVSMLSYAAEERLRHPIVLFYANRHLEDAAFLGLLWRLERANPRFRFVPTFTRTTNNN